MKRSLWIALGALVVLALLAALAAAFLLWGLPQLIGTVTVDGIDLTSLDDDALTVLRNTITNSFDDALDIESNDGAEDAIHDARRRGFDECLERWRGLRRAIHADVCAHAYDGRRNAFTQAYGSPHLDASLLLIPHVGFLPPNDPRVLGTVAAIERELLHDGFVQRYPTVGQDGLPPGEGVFLACSFWLADCYALMGRTHDARALYERLLALRNDVGLLAEEYDPVTRRQLGNFPQAFSHVGLVNTAFNLTPAERAPVRNRQKW